MPRASELADDVQFIDAIAEIVEVCTDDCDEGWLRVVVRVGNGGLTTMPVGVSVQLYGDVGGELVLLAEQSTPVPVASGETSEGLLFELSADQAETTLTVVVDGTADDVLLMDCNTDNDTSSTTTVCP